MSKWYLLIKYLLGNIPLSEYTYFFKISHLLMYDCFLEVSHLHVSGVFKCSLEATAVCCNDPLMSAHRIFNVSFK